MIGSTGRKDVLPGPGQSPKPALSQSVFKRLGLNGIRLSSITQPLLKNAFGEAAPLQSLVGRIARESAEFLEAGEQDRLGEGLACGRALGL